MTQALMKLWKDEDAPTAVEYGFMLFLIIVVCVGVVTSLGTRLEAVFQQVLAALS
jgi:pilus assembly protein Flp/PilA